MGSGTKYHIEGADSIPLDSNQREKVYGAVGRSYFNGDWEGFSTDRGVFHIEFIKRGIGGEDGRRTFQDYTATLDTKTESLDFDFRIVFESNVGHQMVLN